MSGLVSSITPQDNFHADSSYQQSGLNYSQNQLQNTQQGQQSLAQALLAQSQGQGVNLAQAQLNQATDQNMKQNAGFVASQKGLSPALAARLAAQNQAGMSQQAAQQGAILAGQQQLNSQNQLAGVYGNMAGTDVQNSQIMQGGINSANQINAGVASANAGNAAAIEGGLISGGAKAGAAYLAASTGGKIPGHALVHGNSPKNDTVPTMLSPGEIVIPRSAATSLEKAKAFIEKIKAEKNPKLTGESEEHYQLAHPDGTKFHVLKKGISPKLQAQLEAMKEPQKLFDGGVAVDPNAVAADDADAVRAPAQVELPADGAVALPVDAGNSAVPPGWTVDKDGGLQNPVPSDIGIGSKIQQGLSQLTDPASYKGIAEFGDGQPAAAAPASVGASGPPKPAAPDYGKQEALPKDTTAQNLASGFKGEQNVYKDQLALQDKIGQNEQASKQKQAEIYGQQLEAIKTQDALIDQTTKALNQHSDQLEQALQSKAVDPNRFWANKSTGNKIGTMISMVLGGIGAGMQHSTHNLAAEMVDKQIDQDIDAQKADISKQQNLLHYNMQKYQNQLQAQIATKAQLMVAFNVRLQQQAAQDGSANAINIAKLAGTDTRLKIQQLNTQLANMQVTGTGGSGNGDLASSAALPAVIRATIQDPKARVQAMKELADYRAHKTKVDTLLSTYDQAVAENGIGSKIGRLGTSSGAMDSLRVLQEPLIHDAQGRVVPEAVKRMDQLNPGFVSNMRPGLTKEHRDALREYANMKAPSTETLQSYGINIAPNGQKIPGETADK